MVLHQHTLLDRRPIYNKQLMDLCIPTQHKPRWVHLQEQGKCKEDLFCLPFRNFSDTTNLNHTLNSDPFMPAIQDQLVCIKDHQAPTDLLPKL